MYNVGGAVHIEHAHRLFRFNDRDLSVMESFFSGWMKPAGRLDTTGGNEMYFLYMLAPAAGEASRSPAVPASLASLARLAPSPYPHPPYLPGLDARIAEVETLASEGDLKGAVLKSREITAEFPSSRWLQVRLSEARKLKPQGNAMPAKTGLRK